MAIKVDNMVPDCLSCLLKRSVRFSSIFGVPCVSISCTHDCERSKISVGFSKFYFCAAIFVLLSPTIACFYYVRAIHTKSAKETYTEYFPRIMHLLCCLRSISFVVFILIKNRHVKTTLQAIDKILVSYKIWKQKYLLKIPAMEKLKARFVVMVAVPFVAAIVYGCYLLMNDVPTVPSIYLNLTKTLCMYTDTLLITKNGIFKEVFKAIVENALEQLKDEMQWKLSPHNTKKACDGRFRSSLIIARRLYGSMMLTFKEFNAYINLSIVFFVPFNVIITVLNIATVWISYFERGIGFVSYEVKALQFQMIVYGAVVFYETYGMEKLASVSDDILSFLFKYPISKLNMAEAAEVEMLIKTLRTQKPMLRAGDIFTVGTRLLASISGTVVTYVLVVIQFHGTLQKQRKVEEDR